MTLKSSYLFLDGECEKSRGKREQKRDKDFALATRSSSAYTKVLYIYTSEDK